MPEPLAIPRSRYSPFELHTLRQANFGRVSVVMIVLANRQTASLFVCRCLASKGKADKIFSVGRGTPMIPVEEGKTCSGLVPSSRAASRQTSRHAFRPGKPVAQFAFPEFTTTARIESRLARNAARPTWTGAATTRFLVNIAAALVPGQHSTRARSVRPLALIPADLEENENPWGNSISLAIISAI